MKTPINTPINTGRPWYKLSWIVVLISIAWACQKEDAAPGQAAQKLSEATAAENTQMLSTAVDIFDATAIAMNEKGVSDGRIETFGSRNGDHGLDCLPAISGNFAANANNDSIVYEGTLILDYGDGIYCHDSTEFHRGKITDKFRLVVRTHDKDWYVLTEAITFAGFQKDSIVVDGAFTSVATKGSNTITIQNARLDYGDGTFSALSASLTCTRFHGDKWNNHHNDGSKVITGSLSGTSREGISYSASTTNDIVFDYSCTRRYPVSGTLSVTIGGTASVLDYGTGVCDNTYTITTSDSTTVHTFWYKQHHKKAS